MIARHETGFLRWACAFTCMAALFFACCAAIPDCAWASVSTSANPGRSITELNQHGIWTKSKIGKPSVSSKTNCSVSGDWLLMDKNKSSCKATLTFKNAGYAYGGASIDYVLTCEWTVNKSNNLKANKDKNGNITSYTDQKCVNAKTRVFRLDETAGGYFNYGWNNSSNNASGIYRMYCKVTMRVYYTGTTSAVSGNLRMTWNDIDQYDHHSSTPTSADYSSGYAERLKLRGGYGDKQYVGKAASGHKVLNYYKDSDGNMNFKASHVCDSQHACARVSYLATDNHKITLFGTNCETRMGWARDIPAVSVQLSPNGGYIPGGSKWDAEKAWTYTVIGNVIKTVKSAQTNTLANKVYAYESYQNLYNIDTRVGVVKPGYTIGRQAVGAATNPATVYNTRADGSGVYFHEDQTTPGGTNPVTATRLNEAFGGSGNIIDDMTVTLFTMWTANRYYIDYYPNAANAIGATGTTTCTYDQNATIASSGFSRIGYTFQGWATTPTGDVAYRPGQVVKNLTTTQNGHVPLYAVWEPNEYQIEYDLEGDDLKEGEWDEWINNINNSYHPARAKYDSQFVVSNPIQYGYRFDGWTISNMTGDCQHMIGAQWGTGTDWDLPTKEKSYMNLRSVSGTVVFKAHWTPVTNLRLHVDDTRDVWRTIEVDRKVYPLGEPVPVGEILKDHTEDARKPNCHHADGTQGLDCWYNREDYTDKIGATADLPIGDWHLYARNWSTVTLAHGAKSDPDTVYTGVDNGIVGDIAEASATPRNIEIAYGFSRNLPEPGSRRVTFDGGYTFPSTLRAVYGWYEKANLTGTPTERWTSSGDATLYKKWDASITDGAQAGRG